MLSQPPRRNTPGPPKTCEEDVDCVGVQDVDLDEDEVGRMGRTPVISDFFRLLSAKPLGKDRLAARKIFLERLSAPTRLASCGFSSLVVLDGFLG